MKIARRFKAGYAVKMQNVPKGRLNRLRALTWLSRPFGTQHFRDTNPALKCRAILKCPFGTKNLSRASHNAQIYFVAFGSGAASVSCSLRGPVRWGIPVVKP